MLTMMTMMNIFTTKAECENALHLYTLIKIGTNHLLSFDHESFPKKSLPHFFLRESRNLVAKSGIWFPTKYRMSQVIKLNLTNGTYYIILMSRSLFNNKITMYT